MDEAGRESRVFLPFGGELPAELCGFAVKDELHQLIRIDDAGWQWPGEPLDGGQLHRGAMRPLVTPKADEAPDGPAPAAQPVDLVPGGVFASDRTGDVLRLLDEPFDEDAGLRISQAARQGVVCQDVG